jgi:hypothetical protein
MCELSTAGRSTTATHLTNAPHACTLARPPPHVHSFMPSRARCSRNATLHVLCQRVEKLELWESYLVSQARAASEKRKAKSSMYIDEGRAERLCPSGCVRGKVEREGEERPTRADDPTQRVHRVEQEPACNTSANSSAPLPFLPATQRAKDRSLTDPLRARLGHGPHIRLNVLDALVHIVPMQRSMHRVRMNPRIDLEVTIHVQPDMREKSLADEGAIEQRPEVGRGGRGDMSKDEAEQFGREWGETVERFGGGKGSSRRGFDFAF